MNDSQSTHSSSSLQELEDRLHRRLMEMINLRNLEKLPLQQARDQVAGQLRNMIQEERVALNEDERQLIVSDIQNEIFGLGPIEPLLADPTVSDILVNRHDMCYVERHGKLDHTDVRFRDDDHLMRIIQKIASDVGRRIDESSPMVDARLADGSRVNAIIPPLALDGPVLSIRKFSVDPLRSDDLIRFRSLTPDMAAFMESAVKARINIIISGGTGGNMARVCHIFEPVKPATTLTPNLVAARAAFFTSSAAR